MNKYYTSNVEKDRLESEELNRNNGWPIMPSQIWRDGNLIPGSPLNIFEATNVLVNDRNLKLSNNTEVKDRNAIINSSVFIFLRNIEFSTLLDTKQIESTTIDNAKVLSFSIYDGQTRIPLVQKITNLKINHVIGTNNRVLHHKLLKNIITRDFDLDDSDFSKSWQFKLYYNKKPLAYMAGNPFVDISAGTIEFRDLDFVKKCNEDLFTIDFYRYIGRLGYAGSHRSNDIEDFSGFDFPIRDDLTLLKSTHSNLVLANFNLDGLEQVTTYILPRPDDMDLGTRNKSGTVVLWETLNWVTWNVGKFDGGKYLDNGTIERVMR